jgi:hypothetical protein
VPRREDARSSHRRRRADHAGHHAAAPTSAIESTAHVVISLRLGSASVSPTLSDAWTSAPRRRAQAARILRRNRTRHGRPQAQGALRRPVCVCLAADGWRGADACADQAVPADEETVRLTDAEADARSVDTTLPVNRPRHVRKKGCCVCCGLECAPSLGWAAPC